jgi:hypothetical protein
MSIHVVVGPCEHAFVTSQGHTHAQFRLALLTKNVILTGAPAGELQHVGLDNALRSRSCSPRARRRLPVEDSHGASGRTPIR